MAVGYRVDNRVFEVGGWISSRSFEGGEGLPATHLETERLLECSPLTKCRRSGNLFLFRRTREAFVLWLEVPFSAIYEVHFEMKQVLHEGDMDIVDQMNATLNPAEREELVEAYWRGNDRPFAPEVIVDGPVLVSGRWGPFESTGQRILDEIIASKAQGALGISPETASLLSRFGLRLSMNELNEVLCEQLGEPEHEVFHDGDIDIGLVKN